MQFTTSIDTNSSVISNVSYYRKTMVVKFNSNQSYTFKKVPRKVYDEFVNSKSVGSYFNNSIKNNYPQ